MGQHYRRGPEGAKRQAAVAAAHLEGHPWDTTTCHFAMPVTLSIDKAWVKLHVAASALPFTRP